ncbi:MAG TPA: DUF2382 domain-containing protein [Thermomicrobiaceae bacterium]|nr:DUF2382 domain-containing protein [Thermomicrobiaceae bacterium]
MADEPKASSILPLEATVAPRNGGWSIRLPVRADQFTLHKVTVLRERVVVRRGEVTETIQVSDRVRQERPRIEKQGELVAEEDDEGSVIAPPPAGPLDGELNSRLEV